MMEMYLAEAVVPTLARLLHLHESYCYFKISACFLRDGIPMPFNMVLQTFDAQAFPFPSKPHVTTLSDAVWMSSTNLRKQEVLNKTDTDLLCHSIALMSGP